MGVVSVRQRNTAKPLKQANSQYTTDFFRHRPGNIDGALSCVNRRGKIGLSWWCPAQGPSDAGGFPRREHCQTKQKKNKNHKNASGKKRAGRLEKTPVKEKHLEQKEKKKKKKANQKIGLGETRLGDNQARGIETNKGAKKNERMENPQTWEKKPGKKTREGKNTLRKEKKKKRKATKTRKRWTA